MVAVQNHGINSKKPPRAVRGGIKVGTGKTSTLGSSALPNERCHLGSAILGCLCTDIAYSEVVATQWKSFGEELR